MNLIGILLVITSFNSFSKNSFTCYKDIKSKKIEIKRLLNISKNNTIEPQLLKIFSPKLFPSTLSDEYENCLKEISKEQSSDNVELFISCHLSLFKDFNKQPNIIKEIASCYNVK